MTKSNHTPTPWIADNVGRLKAKQTNHSFFIKIASPWIEEAWDYNEEARANAALIVHRVNNWDKLVEALEKIETLTLVTNTKSGTLLDQLAAIRLNALAALALTKDALKGDGR